MNSKAENKEEFINTVKLILGNDPLKKRFNKLIGEQIILDFNYNGLRGREAFRNYKNVVDVLFGALSREDGYCADDLKKGIKKAFQVNKNRIYKNACILRQAIAKENKENVIN